MITSRRKKPVWEPLDTGATKPGQFMKYVNRKHNIDLQTYEDLYQWSVGDTTSRDFWRDAYSWLELAPPGSGDVGNILNNESSVTSTSMFPPPSFFPDTSFNLAEFLLREGRDEDVAIHFAREGVAGVEKVTWRDLRDRVRTIRSAMIHSGIVAGDVIAAVISNSVNSIAICLATLSIGAIWSSSSPDLGPEAICDRYGQAEPRMIFADDGYRYSGKLVELEDRISNWSHKLSTANGTLQDVVIIPYCDLAVDLSKISLGCTYQSFLKRDAGDRLEFHVLPFAHPAFILYSSGTTGSPKCIVHSAGGVALKVKTDMILQHNIQKNDIVFQYTTTSWVMWVLNFVNISSGRSMLLFDGSPYYPTTTVLLQLAQDVGVSVFGTSPRYLMDLKTRGIVPRKQFNLEKLRTVTSTGSILSAELYNWFYSKAFPPHAQLISMSGGTDIAGCFVCGTPLLPVYAGEIQAKALGMAIDILDPSKMEPQSVELSGSAGELVCTKPFPSQPLRFLGKEGMKKYELSYFDRFGRGIWCQGDYIQRLTDTGGLIMLGRSDGVLNPSGVRFGSAEIYAVTETFPELDDAICVGQKRQSDQDERVLLFVKMRPNSSFTSELEQRLKTAIRQRHTPRHVPKFIFEVADIPYTVNGKKCEINIKHIVSGRKAAVSGTVANPESLKLYERFQTLPQDGSVPVLVKSRI
ncbi:acetoacetyl-synthase [Thozetella sp. PMI_491]|nr:acetoacetyl-synthase [Thozetella sp. PMI_491]